MNDRISQLEARICDGLLTGESIKNLELHARRWQADRIPSERQLGIEAGFEFRAVCKKTVFYVDRGISHGMKLGAQSAVAHGHEIEIRSIATPPLRMYELATLCYDLGLELGRPIAIGTLGVKGAL